jgi:hypothetical protein
LWDRGGQVLGQVQEERAALRDIQELHAGADREDGHSPVGDLPHQQAVERLAARVHRANRAVELIAVVARIEIAAADHHEALQKVENLFHIGLVLHRGHNDRNTAGGLDAVEVAGSDVRECWSLLARRAVIDIQTN